MSEGERACRTDGLLDRSRYTQIYIRVCGVRCVCTSVAALFQTVDLDVLLF